MHGSQGHRERRLRVTAPRENNVNIVILHSETTRKSQKDWNFTQIWKMDEEDEHSPSEFHYPEDLGTFDAETETGITES